ncbi:MAG: hypothetical protein AVDCRST_MAG14-1615, partial [uncultured Rubrobacteraceae bacterium]
EPAIQGVGACQRPRRSAVRVTQEPAYLLPGGVGRSGGNRYRAKCGGNPLRLRPSRECADRRERAGTARAWHISRVLRRVRWRRAPDRRHAGVPRGGGRGLLAALRRSDAAVRLVHATGVWWGGGQRYDARTGRRPPGVLVPGQPPRLRRAGVLRRLLLPLPGRQIRSPLDALARGRGGVAVRYQHLLSGLGPGSLPWPPLHRLYLQPAVRPGLPLPAHVEPGAASADQVGGLRFCRRAGGVLRGYRARSPGSRPPGSRAARRAGRGHADLRFHLADPAQYRRGDLAQPPVGHRPPHQSRPRL